MESFQRLYIEVKVQVESRPKHFWPYFLTNTFFNKRNSRFQGIFYKDENIQKIFYIQ